MKRIKGNKREYRPDPSKKIFKGKGGGKSMEEREDYLMRKGLSKLGLEQERKKGRSGKEIIENPRRRDTERQGQAQHSEILKV